MIVNYTVGSFIKDNIVLYERVKYYVDNYERIFVDRAKKIYPSERKEFLRKVAKTDKDFYADFVNDEVQLGADQIEFLCDLDGAKDFCKTMKYLIDYSGLKYTAIKGESVTFGDIKNIDFFNSTIELDRDDLFNIKRSKLFVDKYFE